MEFQHTPLQSGQIRLLKLLRGKPSKYLKCELQPVVIDSPDCPRYTAISYCWGDPSLSRTIMLNQKLCKVTESVYDLLNSLLSKAIGWVWIDALCINQNDNDEKSWQIGYMGRIYSSTRLVYVWLGNEADGSSSAISFLKRLCFELPTLEDKLELEQFLNNIDAPQGRSKWKALSRLCNRAWFFRIWVIQEVVLSTNTVMVCGNQQIPFLDLWLFFLHMTRLRVLGFLILGSQEPFASELLPRAYFLTALVVAMQDSLHPEDIESTASLDIEDAIMFCGVAFGTNPRDHIYGIYGIFSDDLDKELKPDYNATPEDVYIRTTKHLMLENESLKMLCDAGICASWRLDVPSWVPNYNIAYASSRIGSVFYTASGTLTANLTFSTTTTTATEDLTVSGIILDEIVQSSNQNMTMTSQTVNTTQDLRKWYLEAQLLLATYNACASHPTKLSTDTLWQTLLIGRGRILDGANGTTYETPGPDLRDAFTSFHEYMTRLPEFDSLELDKWETTYIGGDTFMDVFSKATDFFEHAVGHWPGRKLVATREGRLGFVPLAVEVGDCVAVVLGARTPFVLRPGEVDGDFEGKYQLVGECYVHGLMYGEGSELGDVRDIVIY
ncbi:HET-domain-containing protein [Cadophora sp. DSE1049]|nr:HET-domain-containing protein [Cadophora sp. DSE1049]